MITPASLLWVAVLNLSIDLNAPAGGITMDSVTVQARLINVVATIVLTPRVDTTFQGSAELMTYSATSIGVGSAHSHSGYSQTGY